ncbi:unnamed protein product, partial [Rotaria magnacalcarata]
MITSQQSIVTTDIDANCSTASILIPSSKGKASNALVRKLVKQAQNGNETNLVRKREVHKRIEADRRERERHFLKNYQKDSIHSQSQLMSLNQHIGLPVYFECRLKSNNHHMYSSVAIDGMAKPIDHSLNPVQIIIYRVFLRLL